MKNNKVSNSGQTAIEYMLLLMVVVTLVLIGFPKYLPQTQEAANTYFNRVSLGVVGDPSPCGDGVCSFFEDPIKCCLDCPEPTGSCTAF